MRTVIRMFAAVVLLAPCSPASASPIAVNDMITMSDGPGTTGGGEFLMRSVGGAWADFLTFCLQRTEYIDFTHQFRVGSISTYAMSDPPDKGGVGAEGQDQLSWQTAYLYTMFRNGTLDQYDYNNSPSIPGDRVSSANALQNAIWMFEGELPFSYDPANYYVSWANGAVGRGEWTLDDLGNVRALNLYFTDGREAQDQLSLVPEPATLALVGSGTMLWWGRRRRQA